MFYIEVYIRIWFIFTCILSKSYNDLASWHSHSKDSTKKNPKPQTLKKHLKHTADDH